MPDTIEDIFSPSENGDGEAPRTLKKPSKKSAVRRASPRTRTLKKTAAHKISVHRAREERDAESLSDSGIEIGGHISAFNPTPRFYRTIAIGFLAATVALIGGVLVMTVGKATIHIKTKPQTINFDAPISISAQESASAISGSVHSVVISVQKDFSPQNGPEEPALAQGSVVLTNKTAKDQPLVATTRLLTPDNIMFRVRKSVVVPAGGIVTALVIADKPGKEGEIAPSTFRIPGLPDSKQLLIYGESKEAMTGGTVRRAVIAQSDADAAVAALSADLLSQGKARLTQEVNASSTAPLEGVFTSSVKEVKNDHKIGTVADRFTVSLQLEVTGVFYAPDALTRFIASAVQSNSSFAGAVVSPASDPDITVTSADEKNQTAEVHVREGWLVKAQDYTTLIDKKNLAGLSADEAVQSLKGLDWVDDAQVVFSPRWARTIPKNIDKIYLIFQ